VPHRAHSKSCPQIKFIGTKLIEIGASRKYRHHPVEFKRQVVEQSLLPNASVAGLALEHGINANQIFAWRKAYREGGLDVGLPLNLIAVEVTTAAELPSVSQPVESERGMISITIGSALMTVRGNVDPGLLRMTLSVLLAR
jgi:transposase